MKIQAFLGKFCIWTGIGTLAITITLHLTLGLPPLEAAIEVAPGRAAGVFFSSIGCCGLGILGLCVTGLLVAGHASGLLFRRLLKGWPLLCRMQAAGSTRRYPVRALAPV